MNNQIEWRRVFIRSGFAPRQIEGGFNFGRENHGIQQFLGSILQEIGQGEFYKRDVFSPTRATVDESAWLAVIEELHIGSEGGNSDMNRFDMGMMDTYMAGIVRWINSAGIETTFSCDGHGYKKAEANLRYATQELCLNYFLEIRFGWRMALPKALFSKGG